MATYNNEWLFAKQQLGETVDLFFFWGHHPAKDGSISKSCLSQWWQAAFTVNNVTYKTAEHWMMAEKAKLFGDENTLEKIIQAETPDKAKRLGRLVEDFDSAIWDAHRYDIVVTGNYYKFSQHPQLRNFLFSTKDAVLVEASPVDSVWGIGLAATDPAAQNPLQWQGLNLLGYALMEVRDKLKQNTVT
jgi:ribA/ribD-fused uncharacterized protein